MAKPGFLRFYPSLEAEVSSTSNIAHPIEYFSFDA
jgi:hypothetical protein